MLGLRMTSRHQRSRSFPVKKGVEGEEDHLSSSQETELGEKQDRRNSEDSAITKNKHSMEKEAQNGLQQEILQLEKRLHDQFQIRHALEKALGYGNSSGGDSSNMSMPKPATELIKDIALLELEVVYLEQYLLSLYRKAFDQKVSSVSPAKDKTMKSPLATPRGKFREFPEPEITQNGGNPAIKSDCQTVEDKMTESNSVQGEDKLLDSSVHRCQSSLYQRSAFPTSSSPADSLGRAMRSCHSQPLSTMEYTRNAPHLISLAEHLGTRISDHIPETPNRISEDMIKCMSAIYCKLSDPPLTNNGLSSPNSSLSSMSEFSPHDQCVMWSPGFKNNSSFDVRLDNPFHVEGLQEFSGPYSTMVEIPWIYRDSQKLGDVEHLLQNFKSLISRLETVDLRKLKHEEKLAFWINIHNALVMHAFLAYGIPQNNIKRLFLLMKAAYNVGGHVISADSIQNSILGCRMPRPSQWICLLLKSKGKFKSRGEQQAYAIEQPESLLHFALSSGSHSDPAVRAYTPKRVFQELEASKEEYIRATFGIHKEQKILLPKLVEAYAKDSGLCPAGIMEMIQQALPKSLRRSVTKYQPNKSRKGIEWIPHNFTFRYLISKELVR